MIGQARMSSSGSELFVPSETHAPLPKQIKFIYQLRRECPFVQNSLFQCIHCLESSLDPSHSHTECLVARLPMTVRCPLSPNIKMSRPDRPQRPYESP